MYSRQWYRWRERKNAQIIAAKSSVSYKMNKQEFLSLCCQTYKSCYKFYFFRLYALTSCCCRCFFALSLQLYCRHSCDSTASNRTYRLLIASWLNTRCNSHSCWRLRLHEIARKKHDTLFSLPICVTKYQPGNSASNGVGILLASITLLAKL